MVDLVLVKNGSGRHDARQLVADSGSPLQPFRQPSALGGMFKVIVVRSARLYLTQTIL